MDNQIEKKASKKLTKTKKITKNKEIEEKAKIVKKDKKKDSAITNKKSRIDYEVKRLNKVLEELPPNVKKISKTLIEECAYVSVTLKQLRKEVDEEGVITKLVQGDYVIDRENPKMKIYKDLLQKQTAIVSKLLDQLPKETKVVLDDITQSEKQYDDFLNENA